MEIHKLCTSELSFKETVKDCRMSFSLPEWSLPNAIWIGISACLAAGYVSTYLIQSHNNVGKGIRYILEYGKFKTYKAGMDIPKRQVFMCAVFCLYIIRAVFLFRYFTHFYQLASVWNTACLITVYLLYMGIVEWNWIADLFGLKDSLKPKGI